MSMRQLQNITPSILEAESLLKNLCTLSDDLLVVVGVADIRVAAQRAYEFISCNRAITHTRDCLGVLTVIVSQLKRQFEYFLQIGLPASFFADGYTATKEQMTQLLEQYQQDQTFLQVLGNSPTTVDVEYVIHPLAQLTFSLEQAFRLMGNFLFRKIFQLDQAFAFLHTQTHPSVEEWDPLQKVLSQL